MYRFYITAAETGDVVALQEVEIMLPLNHCITEEFETTPPTDESDRGARPPARRDPGSDGLQR